MGNIYICLLRAITPFGGSVLARPMRFLGSRLLTDFTSSLTDRSAVAPSHLSPSFPRSPKRLEHNKEWLMNGAINLQVDFHSVTLFMAAVSLVINVLVKDRIFFAWTCS